MTEPVCQPCTIQSWPAFDFLLALSVVCLVAMLWAAAGYGFVVAIRWAWGRLMAWRECRLEKLDRHIAPDRGLP